MDETTPAAPGVSQIDPDGPTIGITRFHVGTRTMTWDARAAALFDDTGDRPPFEIWAERVHPDDHDVVADLYRDALASIGAECVYRIRRPNGEIRYVLTRSVAIEPGSWGGPDVLTGVVLELDPELGREALLTHVLDNVTLGFVILGRDMTVRYINAQSEKHLGVRRSHVLGHHIHHVLPALRDTYLDYLHREVLRTEGEVTLRTESIYLPGTTMEVTATCVDDVVAISYRDVTEETRAHSSTIEAYRELLIRSRLDDLTGVLNRAALFERIARISDELSVPDALLFIDVDDFKTINDTYGHITGDLVLRTTAQRLSAECDSSMVIGRIGGDEFVVALFPRTELGSPTAATDVADRMHRSSAAPIFTASGEIGVSISIGIAQNHAGCAVEELLSSADDALYRAKKDHHPSDPVTPIRPVRRRPR
ncbi:diguanylate cyclase [Rhodococcus sp. BP-252]|uniref:GGDEF domain-containing protein n=1 Tax=unclassified Rhodococcus (in: high G+C Gram-positive bacteria) TaxID=192944 RepID=UPI001C9BA53E|nr:MULTISPECIES: sensor domain-containing diguanylate cyclase [unclassified Rhodococcus (in: high G+C Gram-positive bacteria)]MBY6411494.1 diguanylate cyclase [Rhodococcus sp. BP-320]MBY6416153.1 diguanylate cyclase [Rhodococcus sp. BP-321]MBY6423523.1 diguanylate cyclase [Rhodococcus sp. BP-324]MBY6426360.1 diguanylate cyclase [Rhodococcus sp. BP-323]MBY6431099.1 diguanylate cyclase [Rhodococcus sp. BP-322]